MSESALFQTMLGKLKDSGPCFIARHEDAVTQGVPDVSYAMDDVHGWIELKHLAGWPARRDTIVSMHRYTDEQRNFILQAGHNGGRAFLLLQVDAEYFLFGHWAAQLVGKVNRVRLFELALGYWDHGLVADEFREHLRESSWDETLVKSVLQQHVGVKYDTKC
jgi:hypothetical protein